MVGGIFCIVGSVLVAFLAYFLHCKWRYALFKYCGLPKEKRSFKAFLWAFFKSYVKFECIILAIALFIGGCVLCGDGGSSSSWDKLTDKEKQWYHDNYGDGQYEKYEDAIDNYKGY